ncbi:MAG: lipopolysaccharide biosynthesis protein [Oscillospiraceae bacterium]
MKKENVLSSLLFKFLERCGVHGVQFVVGIVLARILSPGDYGIQAIVMVFITIANVFVQTGLSTALVQNKDTSEDDYSTVFIINLGISIVLYLVLFVSAPFISGIYANGKLCLMIRVLASVLFFGAYSSIVNAMLIRAMRFKTILKRSLLSSIISGLVGIILAMMGAGIWALIIQQITAYFSESVILFLTVRWFPKVHFQKKRAGVLVGFGWKLTLAAFIDAIYKELRSVLIGKKYTPDVLGYYNRARQFPQLLVTNINGVIQTVMLPVLSEYQDEKSRLKAVMRRSMKTSTYVVFPMLAGLAGIAPSLIRILLTEKWMPCVPMLQLLCFNMAFYPIHTANLQAINAMGRSDIYLKLEIIKKSIGVSILVIAYIVFESIYAIVVGGLIGTVLESILNAFPNRKLLRYSYLEQIKDIFPSIGLTLIMFVSVLVAGRIMLSDILVMFIQIIVGVSVYIGLSMLFHVECFEYLYITVKGIIKRK